MKDMQKIPPSERVQPLMVYMAPPLLKEVKSFSKKNKMATSQVVREGVAMRMADGDPYNNGFNDGIECAIDAAQNSNGGQIRFPDGKTFADCVAEDLKEFKR
jgi:polygalacturonase